jgi:NitT/TauT family transport system ATP-binding protein
VSQPVAIGFVPLVDAALLIVAKEEGFAAQEGLDLTLVREGSWAAVRDKLNVGLFDAAHMLAPAAIASTLGLGHLASPWVSPIGLGMNGNAITISRDLATTMRARIGTRSGAATPARTAAVIGDIMAERKAKGQAPLVAAAVFSHSCHLYLLRRWLASGGVDPEAAAQFVIIPPPLMADSLKAGQIDLFCAGAPWNTAAEAAGSGFVLHAGRDIIPDCPEKWLVLRAANAEQPWVSALVRAIVRASRWACEADNLPILARHLARPDYLAQPPALILDVLRGRVGALLDPADAPFRVDYVRFDLNAIAPSLERTRFITDLMVEAGQVPANRQVVQELGGLQRPDIYAQAILGGGRG